MPCRQLLFIIKTEEHLTDLVTYKKLYYDTTQSIRNDFFSTLDFLHSTCQVDHRTRNHLTREDLHILHLCISLFCGLRKIYPTTIFPSLPPRNISNMIMQLFEYLSAFPEKANWEGVWQDININTLTHLLSVCSFYRLYTPYTCP